jgi:hypothetical protein
LQGVISTGDAFLESLFICRSYRWIWQDTASSLFEFVVVVWVREGISSSGNYHLDSLMLQLLLASLFHNRFKDFTGKLYFVWISIITSLVFIYLFIYLFIF